MSLLLLEVLGVTRIYLDRHLYSLTLHLYNFLIIRFSTTFSNSYWKMSASQNAAQANCTKCGIKHSRPVGVRCKRLLNISAPVMDSNSELDSDSFIAPNQAAAQPASGSSSSGSSSASASGCAQTASVNMEAKLDLILKRMDALENKNLQLEQKVGSTRQLEKSQISHSSPKKSHICSRSCTAGHTSRSRVTSKKSLGNNDDSDDATLDSSYSHLSHHGRTSHNSEQVSIDFLKNDEEIQRKVQRQLEKLQGTQRQLSTGNKTIKSGLHRAGDSAVKQEINWPHHHCFPGPGGQLPDYKELSPLQFMVGFLGCLQEEGSSTVRSNMIEYGRHLFQDAIETNWATAKHAHMVLLQDIERGKCSWRNPDKVEKVRIRNTARIITPKQPSTQQKFTKGGIRKKFAKISTKTTASIAQTTHCMAKSSSTLAHFVFRKWENSAAIRSKTV